MRFALPFLFSLLILCGGCATITPGYTAQDGGQSSPEIAIEGVSAAAVQDYLLTHNTGRLRVIERTPTTLLLVTPEETKPPVEIRYTFTSRPGAVVVRIHDDYLVDGQRRPVNRPEFLARHQSHLDALRSVMASASAVRVARTGQAYGSHPVAVRRRCAATISATASSSSASFADSDFQPWAGGQDSTHASTALREVSPAAPR